MNLITSSQNSIIKDVKSLKLKKHREQKNLYFIEGIRFVEEALKEDVVIERILISDQLINMKGGKEIIEKINLQKIQAYTLSEQLFKEISDTENPQGILAVVKMRHYSLRDVMNQTKENFIVILDSIQDPGNLGTIIRTADAAGCTCIILSKGCVDPYNPKVLRSTMGSVFHVPLIVSDCLLAAISELKNAGTKVYASHLKGNTTLFEWNLEGDTAIIIGNEANGISDEIAALADQLVKIPMSGKAESLNASVAAGLFIYEVLRNRLGK